MRPEAALEQQHERDRVRAARAAMLQEPTPGLSDDGPRKTSVLDTLSPDE